MYGKSIIPFCTHGGGRILPIKEQYIREGKFTYGDSEKYKEYEENLSKLTQKEKEEFSTQFDEKMKDLFKLFSENIALSPSDDIVQNIVSKWKLCFEKLFKCDKDILMCIASTYKFANRFKSYINRFGSKDSDLSDFIYKAVVHYCYVK